MMIFLCFNGTEGTECISVKLLINTLFFAERSVPYKGSFWIQCGYGSRIEAAKSLNRHFRGRNDDSKILLVPWRRIKLGVLASLRRHNRPFVLCAAQKRGVCGRTQLHESQSTDGEDAVATTCRCLNSYSAPVLQQQGFDFASDVIREDMTPIPLVAFGKLHLLFSKRFPVN